MAQMNFDENGLLKEPCISCDKYHMDILFYEWYCDEKECICDPDREKAISIAEEFSEWLEDMAEQYNLDKDDVQALIKQFLMCGK